MKKVVIALLDLMYSTEGSKPHIQISAEKNDSLSGSTPFKPDNGNVTLNLSPNAVGKINHYDEYMSVECAKDGYRVRCVVYYSSILFLYDRDNSVSAVFNLNKPNVNAQEEVQRPKLSIVK